MLKSCDFTTFLKFYKNKFGKYLYAKRQPFILA
jgi:hypothetical protein